MDIALENEANVGLQKVSLKDIHPAIYNALIVGAVIQKQRPKTFLDVKSKENNVYRGVFSFTLRDSPQDFINVTFWGKADSTHEVFDRFQVGDAVEIRRPSIYVRKFNDYGEQFRPMVTSPYALTLNEHVSDVILHEGGNDKFLNILRIPTKPPGFVPIRDIQNRGLAMKGELVDVLGAVQNVGPLRTIKKKDGDNANLREILVFDQTGTSLRVTFWDPYYIEKALSWSPRTTILFLTDLKVDWSNFLQCTTTGLTSRSIITENPLGRDALGLKNYAATAPIDTFAIMDHFITTLPDPRVIQNIMSIRQFKEKLELSTDNQQITALLFVHVTHFDIDGFSRVISTKCGHCKSFVKEENICPNEDCPVHTGNLNMEPDIAFDMRIEISDHTGTLPGCRLSGQVAARILNCSPIEFVNMSDSEKCSIKYKFLMEMCEVRIVGFSSNLRSRSMITIISCDLANSAEVAQKITFY